MTHRSLEVLVDRCVEAGDCLSRLRVGTRALDKLTPFVSFGIRFCLDVISSTRSDDSESMLVLLHLDRSCHVDLGDRNLSQKSILLTKVRDMFSSSTKQLLIERSGKTHLVTLVHC